METIVSAVKSSQSIHVSENIKVVCHAIVNLKESGKENDVKAFLETVNFDSAFEKLVAVKLINAFKLRDNLISAFSTEDLFVISQSLKCNWFFEDDNGLLSDKNLVLNFFSKLSYSGRCKVIRKYSKSLKNTERAESLILLLEEIFGIGIALELLPACSESFITDFLYSRDVVLPERIVEQLYQKYPDFTVDFIFSYYEKKNSSKALRNFSESYSRTILKIASEKTALFIEFFNKYGSSVYLDKLGRSLTHKILKSGYPSVLRNTDLYFKIFHIKLVVSYLTRAQIEELHFCLLPKTLNKFNDCSLSRYCKDSHSEVLDNLKTPLAEEILVKNFKKKYGKDPLEADLDENWIKFFPQEIRIKWAENKLTDKDLVDSKKADLYVFFPFDQAFNKLKSLIPTSLDINARIYIIECMMRSAKMYKSSDGASQIISYIVSRHRNDNMQVKGKSLDELREGFDLTKLTVEQWTPIIELFNIMIINNDVNNYTDELISVYGKWVQCRLAAGLPIDNEMEMIMKHIGYYCEFNIAAGTLYERACLQWFSDNLLKKQFANDREKFNFGTRLFCAINEFNVKNPDSCIKQEDWVMQVVKENMEKSYSRNDIVETLKKNTALKFEIYDAIFPKVIFPEMLLYKLTHNIDDILNNVEVIVHTIMNTSQVYSYKSFFLRILLFRDLPNKFTEACLKLFNTNDEDNSIRYKENGIVILSLLNPNLFLSFIEDYYPTGPIAESEGTEAYQKYRIQSSIATSLKNVNPPYKSLAAIKKYSIGDYLKLVLGSVLSVSLRISQTRALEFIKDNLDTPISYRKHIIRVFRLVASKTAVSDLLLSSVKNEKNISLRIILFNSILDMIKMEKSQLSWETVKQSFAIITETDLKQLNSRIFLLQDIPLEYQAEYIEIVWATLKRLEVSNETKAQIFSLINTKTITLISNEFADLLFGLTYSEENDSHYKNWNKFIALYLNCSKKEDFEKRLRNVMELTKNKLCASVGKQLNSTVALASLLSRIVKTSLFDGNVIDPCQLLSELNTRLLKILPEYEIHEVIFSIALHQIYIKNNRSNIIGFADDVCGLVDLHCTTYGPYIIQAVSSYIFNFCMANFRLENINSELVLSHRLVTGPTPPSNKIVGVNMLPSSIDLEDESDKKLYDSIIDAIHLSPDHALKIHAKNSIFD